MVNFNNIQIVRAVMHKINPRNGEVEASVTPSTHLLELDDDSTSIISSRLCRSFSQESKSFELSVENIDSTSCYALLNGMDTLPDSEFIQRSTDIAELLAGTQVLPIIPGGFLVIIDCIYNNLPLYVIIKAEPHDALGVTDMNIHTIRDIILSPDQKMYKASYWRQKSAEVIDGNSYEVFLFDQQASFTSRLAQYFYHDFLGLTISGNAKIQTSYFYGDMVDLIDRLLIDSQDPSLPENAKDWLRSIVESDSRHVINPRDIINEIIPTNFRDQFLEKIVDHYPISFVKDNELVRRKLEKKSVILSDNVRVSAPTFFFNENVQIDYSSDQENIVVRIRRPR